MQKAGQERLSRGQHVSEDQGGCSQTRGGKIVLQVRNHRVLVEGHLTGSRHPEAASRW